MRSVNHLQFEQIQEKSELSYENSGESSIKDIRHKNTLLKNNLAQFEENKNGGFSFHERGSLEDDSDPDNGSQDYLSPDFGANKMHQSL